jgi:Icc-related predicted phosphoesterase
MLVAAIYDIHANLPALDAVLQDIHQLGADRVIVGGDVLPGPMPREALSRLLQLDIPVNEIGLGNLTCSLIVAQRTDFATK